MFRFFYGDDGTFFTFIIAMAQQLTQAQWVSQNPTLVNGNIGVETDTGRAKIGNGISVWLDLPYFASGLGIVGDIVSHTHTASNITDFMPIVRTTPLPNFTVINSTVDATDGIETAIGKLQGQIASNIPVSRLASGTNATAQTYWRGDGVWATPAGAGDVVTNGTQALTNKTLDAELNTIPQLHTRPTESLTTGFVAKGGIVNGDFRIPDSSSTSWLYLGNAAKYAWQVLYGTGTFTTSVSRQVVTCTLSAFTSGNFFLRNTRQGSGYDTMSLSSGKTYRIHLRANIKSLSGGHLDVYLETNTPSYASILLKSYTTVGVIDESFEFVNTYSSGQLVILFTGGTIDSDLYSVELAEVDIITVSVPVATRPDLVISGSSTIDNLESSDTGAYANTYTVPVSLSENATDKKSWTPTKKYISKIAVYVVSKGTGDWTMTVHDSSHTVIASKTLTNANLTNNTYHSFDVPFLASGTYHIHLTSTVADGTVRCDTTNDFSTCNYTTRYARRTGVLALGINGTSTLVNIDTDGLLAGAVIDIFHSKYLYANPLNSESSMNTFALDCHSASAGDATGNTLIIGGWKKDLIGFNGITSLNNGTARELVMKHSTAFPIRRLRVRIKTYYSSGTGPAISVSSDGIVYTTIGTGLNGGYRDIETDAVNGRTIAYVRLSKTGSDSLQIADLRVEADLDTSLATVGMLQPIGTIIQHTETWRTVSSIGRVYYRSGRYTGSTGVSMPCLEFTDTSGTHISHISIPVDHREETNPSVSILLAETTGGQASGTGTAEGTTGYILNDGEYMTFTSGATEGKITYKIGYGTTTFANISKNAITISHLGNANASSTVDSSGEAIVTVGVHNQGILEESNRTNSLLHALTTSTISPWQDYIPTLTWTGGTPLTNVVCSGRYRIVGKTVSFVMYYGADDANANSSLTVGLPTQSRNTVPYVPLIAQHLLGGYWADPYAFIDANVSTIRFNNYRSATVGQSVAIMIQGSYEMS